MSPGALLSHSLPLTSRWRSFPSYLAIYAGLALVLIINNGLDSYLRLVGVQNVGKVNSPLDMTISPSKRLTPFAF